MDEYFELRQEFSKIDKTNQEQIKNWFTKYSHLNVYDHARIIGKNPRYIREMKYRVGIKGKAPTTKKRGISYKNSIILLPDNWRNKEYIEKTVRKYGADSIYKAAGICRQRFYQICKALNVKFSENKSRNPCCTKAWCHRHYVELGYSLEKCAKLAHITHPKFANWLVKFGISIRGRELKKSAEKLKADLPLNVRMVLSKLNAHPLVKKATVYPKKLSIKYKDGCKDSFRYKVMNADDWVLDNIPKIYPEYATLEGNQHPEHIAISRVDLNNASCIEKRVVLHEVNKFLQTTPYKQLTYPTEILSSDWEKLTKANLKKPYIKGTLRGFGEVSHTHGYYLLHQYFDFGDIYAATIRSRRRLFQCIINLSKQSCPFNSHNIYRTFCKDSRNPYRIVNPVIYKNLFKIVGVESINDIGFAHGSIMLGAAISNIPYSTKNPQANKALDYGLSDMIEIDIADDDADCSICDLGYKEGDIKMSLDIKQNKLLAFVEHENATAYAELYKPDKIIPIRTSVFSKIPDYYFFWH